ncbi:hypothetical protein K8I61_11300 [bacterium]|nr:hypothetical protein [bacterium]
MPRKSHPRQLEIEWDGPRRRVPHRLIPHSLIGAPTLIDRTATHPNPIETPNMTRARSAIRRALTRPFTLTATHNTRQLISFKDDRDGVRHIRVSSVLLEAGGDVWTEIALWVKNSRRHRLFARDSASREYIESPIVRDRLASRRARRVHKLETAGEVYDLQAIFDDLNRRYFRGRCDSRIGWSRVSGQTRARTIRMGSYVFEENLIYVHPALDTREVPFFVIAATIYHEMLHWLLRDRRHPNGQRVVHSAEFNELMEAYPDHHRTERWIDRNLQKLLSRRTLLIREARRARTRPPAKRRANA